jgi:hypothetical protein
VPRIIPACVIAGVVIVGDCVKSFLPVLSEVEVPIPSIAFARPKSALVMELVEGPTLADRIAQGAIPGDAERLVRFQREAEVLASPTPICAETSYGPRRVPGVRANGDVSIRARTGLRAGCY